MKQLNECRVLIVDDSTEHLMILEFLLENICDIHTESKGTKVIDRASELQPDLILLDVVMPGVDGFGLCRALKTNPRTAHTPIVFITSLSKMDDKIEGFAAGGVDYITKPFDRSEVRARVCSHLKLANFENEQRRQIGLLTSQVTGLEELRHFLELEMANAFLHADQDWKILSFNRQWQDWGGEIIPMGTPLWEIAGGLDTEMLQHTLLQAANQGTNHCSVVFQPNSRNERFVSVKASFRFFRDGSDALLAVIGLLTDVSELFQENEALENRIASDRADAASHLAHLESTAHEIRTPLNALQGGLQQIRELELSPKALEAIELIEQGTNALSSVLPAILSENQRNLRDSSGIFHLSSQKFSVHADVPVLIADDIKSNQKIIAYILKSLGFRDFDFVESGEEALETWHRRKHPLILLDYQMDGIDGYETCRRIRSSPSLDRPTILGLSASALAENVDKAFEAGFCAQLPKPVFKVLVKQTLTSLGWEFAA